MWNDFDKYRDDAMMRDFESDDPEKAYREGLKKGRKQGYRKAMEEVEERSRGYGERGGYGMRDGGSSGDSGYGERRSWRVEEEDDDDDFYGERRGVRGTGRYSRSRR